MGIKQSELVPIASGGPTALTPVGKNEFVKVFQVSRTDTTNGTKVVLPADVSVLSITIHGSSVSNAATTATIVTTIVNTSGTISTGTVDVKASGATTAVVQMTALPNVEGFPNNGDLLIKAVYAETGTASTSGGPWTFSVRYVR